MGNGLKKLKRRVKNIENGLIPKVGIVVEVSDEELLNKLCHKHGFGYSIQFVSLGVYNMEVRDNKGEYVGMNISSDKYYSIAGFISQYVGEIQEYMEKIRPSKF